MTINVPPIDKPYSVNLMPALVVHSESADHTTTKIREN